MFSDTNGIANLDAYAIGESECYAYNNTQYNADGNSHAHFQSQSNTEASPESPAAPEPANYSNREASGCRRNHCATWTPPADTDRSPFAVPTPGSNSKTNSSRHAQNNAASASNSAGIDRTVSSRAHIRPARTRPNQLRVATIGVAPRKPLGLVR